MHLLFSSIITEKRFTLHPGSHEVKRPRPEVAISSLISLRKLGFSSAEFHLSFDETTEWSRNHFLAELDRWKIPIAHYESRLESYENWACAADRILTEHGPDSLVAVVSNDDHFLIDKGEEYLTEELMALEQAHEALRENFVVMYPLSHYPEHRGLVEISAISKTLIRLGNRKLVPCQIPGGPMIIKTSNFKALFRTDFSMGAKLVSLENPFGPSLRIRNGLYLVPSDEILRHGDGYGHIGLTEWPLQPILPFFEISNGQEIEHKYVPHPPLRTSTPSPREFSLDLLDLGAVPGHSALLRASGLRFSFVSARELLLNEGHGKNWLSRLFTIVSKDRALRTKALKFSGLFLPMFLPLRILGILSRLPGAIGLHAQWYLTYGSSIGYLKLFWLVAKTRFFQA